MNNKVKIILFDIDGVIIRPPCYFPEKLEKEYWYKNAKIIFNDFFKKYNKDLTEWKKSIKKELLPYLKKINWEKGVNNFLKEVYNFESEYLDIRILEKVRELQSVGIKCYLATSQEKERWEYFLNELNFKSIFDGYFISNELWYRKEDINFWKKLLLKIPNINENEILFFDDSKENIKIAESIGIKSFLFTTFNKFEEDLKLN